MPSIRYLILILTVSKNITKLTASGSKEPLIPHPLRSTVEKLGEGVLTL
jgi:hypothetical protein